MFRRVDGHFKFGVVFEKKLSVDYTMELESILFNIQTRKILLIY